MDSADTQDLSTVAGIVRKVTEQFKQSSITYAHGTDNAYDEACYLVFGILNLDHNNLENAHERQVTINERSKIDRFVRGIENKIDEYESNGDERPPSFYDAYLYFLTSVTCALYQGKDRLPDKENMSMIVHPHGFTDKHEIYLRWIRGLQDEFRFALTDKNSEKFNELRTEHLHSKRNKIYPCDRCPVDA